MKSVIKINKLDLVGLMKESLENNQFVTYPYGVHWGNLSGIKEIKFLKGAEDEPTMDENFEIEGTLEYLKQDDNNYVYINFSDVNVGEPIGCMDGNYYGNDYDDEDEEDEEEIDEVGAGTEMLDDGSTFGYIIQYKEGHYIVNSGIYSLTLINCMIPPTQSINFVEDCLLFDEPLATYLDKFIS